MTTSPEPTPITPITVADFNKKARSWSDHLPIVLGDGTPVTNATVVYDWRRKVNVMQLTLDRKAAPAPAPKLGETWKLKGHGSPFTVLAAADGWYWVKNASDVFYTKPPTAFDHRVDEEAPKPFRPGARVRVTTSRSGMVGKTGTLQRLVQVPPRAGTHWLVLVLDPATKTKESYVLSEGHLEVV